MNRFSKLFLLSTLLALSGLAASGMALADDESTADCMPVAYPPFDANIPGNLTLVPPCARTTPAPHAEFHYAFTGKAKISGEVRYMYLGGQEWPTFSPDRKSLARLREMTGSFGGRFRLDGDGACAAR